MPNSFVIINQARMTSTRLPGKVLKEVLGKPLLEYQIERVRRSKLAEKLVIATTVNPEDQPIVDLCKRMDTPFIRGSELDVLSRYHLAAQKHPASNYIRITSDCPLIDPEVIDFCINEYNRLECDYLSNSEDFPNGMNVEIFSAEMLNEAAEMAQLPYEREHVTPYFYTRPEKFKLAQAKIEKPYPKYRLTVDTPEDFELIKFLIIKLGENSITTTLNTINFILKNNPQALLINSHIVQKTFKD